MANEKTPTALQPRVELVRFARRMEKNLRKHDGTRGRDWERIRPEILFVRVMEELGEASHAFIREAPPQVIAEELADAGAILMMLSENLLAGRGIHRS